MDYFSQNRTINCELSYVSCLPQLKTAASKPQATSSPLASEEDEPANRTSGTGEITVVVQFSPWFKFYFLLFLGIVMNDNEFETKENKT